MLVPDTSYLVGLFIKRDDNNSRSKEIYKVVKYEKLLLNNTILTELLNSFKTSNYFIEPNKIVTNLQKISKIDYLTEKDYMESMKIFNYYNKSINFSDCTILKTMMDNKVTKIVSFDKAFDKVKGIKRIH